MKISWVHCAAVCRPEMMFKCSKKEGGCFSLLCLFFFFLFLSSIPLYYPPGRSCLSSSSSVSQSHAAEVSRLFVGGYFKS